MYDEQVAHYARKYSNLEDVHDTLEQVRKAVGWDVPYGEVHEVMKNVVRNETWRLLTRTLDEASSLADIDDYDVEVTVENTLEQYARGKDEMREFILDEHMEKMIVRFKKSHG